MVCWIYVLDCSENRVYVGKTERLLRRLNEHWRGNANASNTTAEYEPLALRALYRVADTDDPLVSENEITLMFKKLYGKRHWLVRGGKYIDNFQPHNHAHAYRPTRPLCHCKVPAEVLRKRTDQRPYAFECGRSALTWPVLQEDENEYVEEDFMKCAFKQWIHEPNETFDYNNVRPQCTFDAPSSSIVTPSGAYAFLDEDDDETCKISDTLQKAAQMCNSVDIEHTCTARNCTYRGGCIAHSYGYTRPKGAAPLRYIAKHGDVDAAFLDENDTVIVSFCFSNREDCVHLGEEHHVHIAKTDDVSDVSDEAKCVSFINNHSSFKNLNCELLDGPWGAALPIIEYARHNNMKRCRVCDAAQYKAIQIDGHFRALCKTCAQFGELNSN